MTIKSELNSTSSFASTIHEIVFPLLTRPFIISWSFSHLSSSTSCSHAIPPPEPQQLFSDLRTAAHSSYWLWGQQQESCGNQGWDRLQPYNLVFLRLTAPLIYSRDAGPAWNSTRYCCFFKPLNVRSEVNLYFQGSLLTTGFSQVAS